MEDCVDGYEAIRLFGYEAIKLLVDGQWGVNLVDFQQHLMFSLRPHITILAFQIVWSKGCL